MAGRKWAQVAGVLLGMLLATWWVFYGGHATSGIGLGLLMVGTLMFFVMPVVVMAVDGLLPPFITFSARHGKVTYFFADEQFAREFAELNGSEVVDE